QIELPGPCVGRGARNAECYTVSEVYSVDLVKPVPPKNPFNTPTGFDPVSLRKAAVSRCIPPPRQGYHPAHPWCPAARAPGLERLSPSRVVAHHNAHDGCLVAPSRTSRETSVDGTLRVADIPGPGRLSRCVDGGHRQAPPVEKDALCLPRRRPHSLTAACCTTITNLALN